MTTTAPSSDPTTATSKHLGPALQSLSLSNVLRSGLRLRIDPRTARTCVPCRVEVTIRRVGGGAQLLASAHSSLARPRVIFVQLRLNARRLRGRRPIDVQVTTRLIGPHGVQGTTVQRMRLR